MKKKLFFKKLFGMIFLCLIFSPAIFSANIASAEDKYDKYWGKTDTKDITADATRGAMGLEEQQDPRLFIASIVQILLGFLGIIMVVLILVAGYKWMMAQGNADEITKAKDIMKNAVIGLAIVLGAYSIAEMVIHELIQAGKA